MTGEEIKSTKNTDLHDRYVMAAITGLLASNSEDCESPEHLVRAARLVADLAMDAREEK